nr:hypothetical protein CFP56_50728 [Quercus suber]
MGTSGSTPDGNNQVMKMQTSRNKVVEFDKGTSVALFLGEKKLGSTSQFPEGSERTNEVYQEKGLVNTIDETPKESCAISVRESMAGTLLNIEDEVRGQGGMVTDQVEAPKFIFESAQKEKEVGRHMGLELTKEGEGPIAMTYDMELGWGAEVLGPTSGHWKRKAREGKTEGKEKELSPVQKKRNAPTSFMESDQNTLEVKRRRVKAQESNESEDLSIRDGGEADAAWQLRRAQ